ncbi:shikimate kinase [Sphingobacterium sp. UT-1RO-CII-1]|uniref:shikimate kinase n=1 Tax=Sphingobacterium sp. UT-1RO-CII-1 TaxID=2995225 RepID=UPI00227CF68F|nr:shikimate kinase [Sphingobacterium sp. UT-1RO-CII-1]MCY4779965.1 shikimate kinase [Sphingobacterium sp. UT-1RO-CII-1]
MEKPIFLIGFMGSGKTTLGKKLAKRLDRKFIDMDQVIVEKIGMSIPDYFQQYGEDKFREFEQHVLREMSETNTVVSTGGGSPCYFDNMDWIRDNGIAVYLQLSPKALHARLQQSNISSRPALKGLTGDKLLHFIETKLAEREPYYKRAHIAIDQLNSNVESIHQIIKVHAETI